MVNITKRNENAAFQFEILYAGIEFLRLFGKKRILSKIQIKPDRRYGAARRIEDLTKFYNNGTVEVVQIKHSVNSASKFGFGDFWTSKDSKKVGKGKQRREGTPIYKFLKSWRTHRAKTKIVKLTLASNRIPIDDLKMFLSDIRSLRQGILPWTNFRTKYSKQITNIKSNCSDNPFKNEKEICDFISSFYFEKLPNLQRLEDNLAVKLKEQGIINEDRVFAYIMRTTKAFISDDIEVLPQRVSELISRLKTGLIQEILAPENYIERTNLEKEILKAVEEKKRKGGFVTVYAPSGSGKTVLLSQLSAKNADFFPYLCRIRPFEAIQGKTGYSITERLNSKWFKVDIIQRCFEFGLLENNVGLEDDENYVDKMFDEALRILSEKALKSRSKKIVIIIDALDQIETDKFKGKSVLDAIPTINYPGIVFLLSTWGPNYLPQSIKSLPKLEAGIELYFTETEIKKYFDQAGIALTQDHVAIIKNKTNGLAISLLYLGNRLKNKRNIDQIVRSISNYSEVFDWYKPIWNMLNVREKNCLGYLCHHLAPVKRENLREMVPGLNIAAFNILINRIEHFLNITSGYIEPYHDSFRRFIVNKLKQDKKIYNQQLANYYSKNINLPYSQRYITQHLKIVGTKDTRAKLIFERLHRSNFFEKILRTKIDDRTKVEIGRVFVDYFYQVNNVEQLVKYSIVTSDVYPTTYDSNIYEKAEIGTEKLLTQIDEELMTVEDKHQREQIDWVFRRLAIGNILIRKKNKQCFKLAQRLIDDGLFRFRLNPNLLWTEDRNLRDKFWDHVSILTLAMVNVQRYKDALLLVQRIHFKEPNTQLIGFKGIYIVDIHIANLKLNPEVTAIRITKSSKIERLLTYLEIEKQKLPIIKKRDYTTLLNNKRLEKFLYDDNRDVSQTLDLAEALYIHKSKNYKKRILNLINNVKLEVPHSDHGYIYWGYPGDQRSFFLRYIALQSLLNDTFNLNEFYSASLKEKYPKSGDEKENKNKDFLNILSIEQELAKNRLLLRSKRIDWNMFWEVVEKSLKIFQEKVLQIDNLGDSDYSDTLKKLLPYKDNMRNIIRDNVSVCNLLFPSKSLTVLNRIDSIIDFKKQVVPLETLIAATPSSSKVSGKLENYLNTSIKLRQKEKLDSTGKSDNLRSLSTLAAKHGFSDLAEKTFEKSLKYSRGVWNKGDLRFTNLVDTLRTQNKIEFETILRYLYQITDIVEKTWYWKLDFLESAAFADFNMSLDFLYSLITKNEVNENDGLSKIILTYIKWHPYNTLRNILPLLGLLNIKNESVFDFYENITKTYFSIISWSLQNHDIKIAQELALRYFNLAKQEIEPPERIKLLRNFVIFLLPHFELGKIKNEVDAYVNTLLHEGYIPVQKTGTDYEITQEAEINNLKLMIYRKRIKALFKYLANKAKTDKYMTSRIITDLLPYFDYENLLFIKNWCQVNNISLEKCEWLSALIKSASSSNRASIIAKTRSEIMAFMKTQREYEKYRIIKEIDKVDFPGKKGLMKRLLLMCIRELAGSGYYLPQFFMYTSDSMDRHFIDLKKFSFETWKSVFEHSMRLSLSK